MGNLIGNDFQAASKQRSGQELPHGNIKAGGRRLGDHVTLTQFQIGHLGQLVVEHALLVDHHPLGFSGRAGGVDDVGQLIHRRITARIGVPIGGHQRLQGDHLWARFGFRQDGVDLLQAGFRSNQHGRLTAVQHATTAGRRMALIQCQVGTTRLERTHDHRQQVQIARRIQCHNLIRLHASLNQAVADTVGPLVELGVAHAAALAARHFPAGIRQRPGLEPFEPAQAHPVRFHLTLAEPEQFAPFSGRNQLDCGKRLFRRLHQLAQNLVVLVQQRLHVPIAEIPLVVAELKLVGLARQDDHGKRVVGVGAISQRRDAVGFGGLLHFRPHGHILEHKQAVEQGLATRGVCQVLYLRQGQMFVLAQGRIGRLQ